MKAVWLNTQARAFRRGERETTVAIMAFCASIIGLEIHMRIDAEILLRGD